MILLFSAGNIRALTELEHFQKRELLKGQWLEVAALWVWEEASGQLGKNRAAAG